LCQTRKKIEEGEGARRRQGYLPREPTKLSSMSFVQTIQESLKGKSVEELVAVITFASAELKKAVKVETTAPKAPKAPKEKKGSMPKGVVPPQLHKPRAWVDFVLAHANEKGWPAFAVKGQEEPMPASVERDGAHVFESTGKPMNNKHAMSLSKQYWDRKAATGSNQELYEEFESYYVPPEPVMDASEDAATTSAASEVAATASATAVEVVAAKVAAPKKAKKTDEEKLAEKEAKAVEKAKEKEAEKERKEAEKLAEKEVKAAEKKTTKVAKPTVAAKEEKDTFTCADDGAVHPWDWKGKKFLRNIANQVWARSDAGEAGDWQGVFDPATMKIDDSAEEPDFE
jgi:hypothetical protein